MSDAAAHLVDEVLPEAPVRQWVCTLPWAVRKAAGYKRAFCTELIEAFTGVLLAELRRRAKGVFGLRRAGDAHPGLVVFVQRSDGALRLNVHVLALDGAYVRGTGGTLAFHALLPTVVVPPPFRLPGTPYAG